MTLREKILEVTEFNVRRKTEYSLKFPNSWTFLKFTRFQMIPFLRWSFRVIIVIRKHASDKIRRIWWQTVPIPPISPWIFDRTWNIYEQLHKHHQLLVYMNQLASSCGFLLLLSKKLQMKKENRKWKNGWNTLTWLQQGTESRSSELRVGLTSCRCYR